MSWIIGEVDGVAINRRSIIGTSEWGAAKDMMVEYMAAQLSDRLDMGESVADSFADSGDVSGGVCTSGYVKNNETAAVAATSGGIINPQNSNWTTTGGSDYQQSNGTWIATASSIYSTSYHMPGSASNNITDSSTSFWNSSMAGMPQWVALYNTAGAVALSRIEIAPYVGLVSMPLSFQIQGSNNNGASWTTLKTVSNESGWASNSYKGFDISGTWAGIRIYVTTSARADVVISNIRLYGTGTPYQPAYPDPTTITVTPYTPETALEKVRVTLMLEDVSNSGAIALGHGAEDMLQAYLSYDGNSSFSSALTFSKETYPLTSGSNIYVFNSDDVEVSGESISSLGMKLQSFDRGAGAPEFRFHAYIIAGKEVGDE